jgi:hypothetical protein
LEICKSLRSPIRIGAIDTLMNKVIAPSPIGQAAQTVVYVPNAIPAMSENRNAAMTMMPAVPSAPENLQPLQGFMTNPSGAAVVNAIGPIRQLVRGEDKVPLSGDRTGYGREPPRSGASAGRIVVVTPEIE